MIAPYKVLFLCTSNSARSILGEYIMRKAGGGRFETFSAGVHPSGKINPIVQRILSEVFKMDASQARSKSWEEFKGVHFDFVITVCDNAKESCPEWPGQPIVAHWSSPNPADFEGTDEEKYEKTMEVALQINRRIDLFNSLPFEQLEKLRLAHEVQEIGCQEKLN